MTWCGGFAWAEEPVAVVLSSDAQPYAEALSGFKEKWGRDVPVQTLSDDNIRLPEQAKIIVTFGGRAAMRSYASRTTLIYGLAPALYLDREKHSGPLAMVSVATAPKFLAAKLKEIQPSLRRLGVLWVTSNPSVEDYCDGLERAAQGFAVRMDHLSTPDELPAHLRALSGQVDALWLLPDPALITPSAFEVAKQFGRANSVPLYVPMDGLVEKGAVASIAPDFREMGRAAAQLAIAAAAGGAALGDMFPEKSFVTLNLTAAAQAGLKIPGPVIKNANRVVP